MRMLKNNLGYPRVGSHRQLKKACEQYWAGKITQRELHQAARKIKEDSWQLQLDAGIDLIPRNDFSYYDQVLDMSLLLGVIPTRYTPVLSQDANRHRCASPPLALYREPRSPFMAAPGPDSRFEAEAVGPDHRLPLFAQSGGGPSAFLQSGL